MKDLKTVRVFYEKNLELLLITDMPVYLSVGLGWDGSVVSTTMVPAG